MKKTETKDDHRLVETAKRLVPRYHAMLDEAHAQGVRDGEAWVHDTSVLDDVKIRALVGLELQGVSETKVVFLAVGCFVPAKFRDAVKEPSHIDKQVGTYWVGFGEGALKVWDKIKTLSQGGR